MAKTNWKEQQRYVASAFRLVTNADRPAPPEFPDGVPADIVIERLKMEKALEHSPSHFLPEAKSGYGMSKKFGLIQNQLKKAENFIKMQSDGVLVYPAATSSTIEKPNTIMLLKHFQDFLFNIEIVKLDKLRIDAVLLHNLLSFPSTPVISGYKQCTEYTTMKKLINYNFYPVVVWHKNKTRFENDLCIFNYWHLFELSLHCWNYSFTPSFFYRDKERAQFRTILFEKMY